MGDELITGTSFYQFEPLIARLRGIIRDYPEGVGIIKEQKAWIIISVSLAWPGIEIPV